MDKIIKINDDIMINVKYFVSAQYNNNTKKTTVYLRDDMYYTVSLSVDELMRKIQE